MLGRERAKRKWEARRCRQALSGLQYGRESGSVRGDIHETVSMQEQPDGAWLVAGYHVKQRVSGS